MLVAGCVTLGLIGLFFLVASFPDRDLPPYPPRTLFQKGVIFIWAAGSWPFMVFDFVSARLLHGHGDQPLWWFPLWIVSGAFWASVVELFILVRSKLQAAPLIAHYCFAKAPRLF